MKKDQRVVGALVVVIIIVALAIAGVGGYLVFKKGKDTVSNAVATVVESAESKKAFDDCKKEFTDEDLCKALSNFVGTKQYQTTMTMSGMSIVVEVDGSKTYTKQTINGKTLETITADGATYTKDNTDGKWWKQVIPKTSNSTSSDDFKFDTNVSETTTKSTYTKIGNEACDKLTCTKYKLTESGSTDVQYIWIDTKDHLLRKWMVESKDGNTTATYSYNKKSVDIPSNTKDASPTQNVIPADFYSTMMESGSQSSDSTENSSMTDTSTDNTDVPTDAPAEE